MSLLHRSIARFPSARFGVANFGSSCFPPVLCPNPDAPEDKCVVSPKHEAFMEPACKIAMITGGSTGIGLAIARQLLCVGAQKTILVSNGPCKSQTAVTELNKEFGQGKALYYQVDVNSNNQFECLMNETLEQHSQIDILVNAAGIMNDFTWELEVDTNLKACARAMVLAMKYLAKNGSCSKSNGGVVINIAGMSGISPLPMAPIYTATKHGVIGLTRSFGNKYHFKDTNLRVIGLCPGVTTTCQINGFEKKGLTPAMGKDGQKEVISRLHQSPDEVGKAAVYLVKYGVSSCCYVMENGQLSSVRFPRLEDSLTCIRSFRD